ncbi:hypothetical protein FOH24_07130 [Acetobacter tropicalis]|uniref:Uncharacterized protein n=1 Tax=Acetobacter tropicalis TaxID=104102 RepID=A0A094YGJ1_9PROT|nr:hypothetical protein [Acetobacter tropicalis]KAA8387060.1 hypothetical protein FOH22_10475 [Acetobacter tropicalis]KAA8391405.1 hypothetical protein FOH24_07130 [Acetobacter tropicalis]KGB21145.1 hypothetical protein AtDm6_3140 [Acetobacter tropicalis]MBC9008770.1 hypothetical protein [Acetobacter tropicalis]MDO8171943.1 hypothetical protein [Acetobacter tropicalis]
MMADLLTGEDVYAELNTRIRQAGGNTAFAVQARMNDKTVSNIANARRRLSDDVLAVLGLVAVEAYKQQDGKIIPVKAMFAKLNTAMRDSGGNDAFARAHGLNKTTLSCIANTHRAPSKQLLTVLGLEKVLRYIRVPSAAPERLAA